MSRVHWFSRLILLSVIVLSSALSGQSAQAAILFYGTSMSGAIEVVPNSSPATGTATVTIDTVLNTMRVQATFAGLTGNSTNAHIHAPTPASPTTVATQTPSFINFPSGVTSGTMDQTLDLTLASTYNAAYVTAWGGTVAGAQAALLSALTAGTAYYNVHSATFTGGEIRGFLVPVPEPGSMALAGTFALGALARAWRKRRTTAAA